MDRSDWLARGPAVALVLALCLPAVPVVGTLLDNPNAYQGSNYRDYEARCAECLALASDEEDSHQLYCEPEQPDWCNLAAQYRSAAAAESSRSAAWTVALLTLIGVWLLYLTLRTTQQTLEQAIQANNQAGIATEAARDTTFATREIGNAQTRAYLCAFGPSHPPTSALCRPFGVEIEVRNFGQTPARNCSIETTAFIADFPLSDDHEIIGEWKGVGSNITIHPGTNPTIAAHHRSLSEEEVQRCVTFEIPFRIYVAARIFYYDIHNVQHLEQACFSLNYNPEMNRSENANRHIIST